MIARTLAPKLKSLAAQFPVVTVTGPRQAGKTTLVRHVFPGLDYVSLESPDSREFAESDPRGFLATYDKGVIIDEAQRVPDLFSYLQGTVDAKNKPGMFILTGSQNFLLHEKISQTLAGRTAVLKLLPFGLEELRRVLKKEDDPNTAIFRGFYPRIFDMNLAPHDWYSAYVQTYVERDVRLIKNISDLGLFQRFLRLCAGRIGQVVNLSSLASDGGLSHNTARAWLSILESSYIVFLLRPHHRNFNKRLVKMPKLYFLDTGLASYLLGLNRPEQVETHYLRGALFESMIVSDFLKYRCHRGLEPNGYFWRDKTGREVDYLIDTGSRLIPLEIKSGRTIVPDHFSGLNSWNRLSGGKSADSFLVYGGDRNEKRSAGNVLGWKNATSALGGRS